MSNMQQIYNQDTTALYTASLGYKWLLNQTLSFDATSNWSWIWRIKCPEKKN